jgi:putative restriction endonuclease
VPERTFGHIEGIPEGSLFASRAELSAKGLHRPLQAGISGAGEEGADSIVLSGGYEDDQDYGEQVIYTGHGGRDPNSGKQIADQRFIAGNKALALNKAHGLPVRVIRGSELESQYAPDEGYRYDGLYYVDDFWSAVGDSGYTAWRYRLVKESDARVPARETPAEREDRRPKRVESTVLRLVRDTKQSRQVKHLYDYTCQFCGTRLVTPVGAYAEGAHIRPLGEPHNGPDSSGNLLCLCPNHHVLFDLGAISVNDDLTLVGISGRLTVHPQHKLNADHLTYHREHYPDSPAGSSAQ